MLRRNRRTLWLAALTLGVLVWAAVWRFDVPPRELATWLWQSALGVLAVVLLAACATALVVALRVWRRTVARRRGRRLGE